MKTLIIKELEMLLVYPEKMIGTGCTKNSASDGPISYIYPYFTKNLKSRITGKRSVAGWVRA